jgi:tetratricopeptide (TPR) repeat protein
MIVGRSVSVYIKRLMLLAFALWICAGLNAQSRPGPFETNGEFWSDLSQSTMERELNHHSSQTELIPISTTPEPPESTTSGDRTISVDELRHPLSRKGQKLIDRVEKELRAGDRFSAMEELNLALKEPSAAPYAHNILGVELLKVHKVPEAVDEFAETTSLLPGFAAGHSNLGYALYASGQTERGFQEIETALNLDRSFIKAHFLKGLILMERGSGDHEAWRNLEEAGREIPAAHLALALFYARQGQSATAQQQLQDFAKLNPGVTLTQAQGWLNAIAPTQVPAGVALGLWRSRRQ